MRYKSTLLDIESESMVELVFGSMQLTVAIHNYFDKFSEPNTK